MISFEEARHLILTNVSQIGTEQITLPDLQGRITAEEIIAPRQLPFFDNSAMDGYAVRMADHHLFSALPISGYIPAGVVAHREITPRSAVKIMTGAPVPHYCDAVVPLEDAEEKEGSLRILKTVKHGQHIRRAGEDIQQGETLLPAGTLIRVAEISMLASMGIAQVQVRRRPTVAILATGDELIEPEQPLTEGHIFNSNSLALAAAVREAGAIPLLLGIASDDHSSLRQKIETGLAADVLITVAGVSVGDRDLVREVLAEFGVQLLLWKIAMQPGKALAFGLKGDKPVFALPGNPVSSMICFEVLVRPALLKMMSHPQPVQPLLRATLRSDLRKKVGKTLFARVHVEISQGRLLAWSAGRQETGLQKTMRQAEGIAVLEEEREGYSAGEEILVHILSGSFTTLLSDVAITTAV